MQQIRHQERVQRMQVNPWRYRLLADDGIDLVAGGFRAVGLSHPEIRAFVWFRLVQNILLFGLLYLYLRQFASVAISLLGLALGGWSISWSFWHSDLSFATYFEASFYLLALLALHKGNGWQWALIPIIALAALNRETALLMCLLPLGLRRGWAEPVLLLAAFVFVYLYTRAGTVWIPWGLSARVGWSLIHDNLMTRDSLLKIGGVVSILPVLAVVTWRASDPWLRAMFLLVVPLWIGLYATFSFLHETRCLIVPTVCFVIPLVCSGLEERNGVRDKTAPF